MSMTIHRTQKQRILENESVYSDTSEYTIVYKNSRAVTFKSTEELKTFVANIQKFIKYDEECEYKRELVETHVSMKF